MWSLRSGQSGADKGVIVPPAAGCALGGGQSLCHSYQITSGKPRKRSQDFESLGKGFTISNTKTNIEWGISQIHLVGKKQSLDLSMHRRASSVALASFEVLTRGASERGHKTIAERNQCDSALGKPPRAAALRAGRINSSRRGRLPAIKLAHSRRQLSCLVQI